MEDIEKKCCGKTLPLEDCMTDGSGAANVCESVSAVEPDRVVIHDCNCPESAECHVTAEECICNDKCQEEETEQEQAEQQEQEQEPIPDVEPEEGTHTECEIDHSMIIAEIQSALASHNKSLRQLFEQKIFYDEEKDRIIQKLHQELQQHKDDFYGSLIKPILVDLIYFRNDVLKLVKHCRNEEGLTVEKLLSLLEGYAEDVGYILEKYDVEIFSMDSDLFTPIKQQIVEIVETQDCELDKAIAERVTQGYSLRGKIIRPEMVKVYKLQQPANPGVEDL